MNSYSLEINNLSKNFGRRLIFRDINYTIRKNTVLGISGNNGSGKSTFMKIVAGVLSPNKGEIVHSLNGIKLVESELFNYIGFVSPYLVLYEEFSAEENLKIFSKIRGIKFNSEYSKELFEKLNLFNRRKEFVKNYSSGMKQRLKYIFALLHQPELLLLDEPTSNLDSEGKEAVYSIIEKFSEDKIVIIASNEEQDLKYCKELIYLENFK
jgi:heme exporter protein A